MHSSFTWNVTDPSKYVPPDCICLQPSTWLTISEMKQHWLGAENPPDPIKVVFRFFFPLKLLFFWIGAEWHELQALWRKWKEVGRHWNHRVRCSYQGRWWCPPFLFDRQWLFFSCILYSNSVTRPYWLSADCRILQDTNRKGDRGKKGKEKNEEVEWIDLKNSPAHERRKPQGKKWHEASK